MTWHYKGEIYEPTEDELKQWIGFVYIITNKNDGMKYVGKKTFWSKKTLPPLKGKTRKRRRLRQLPHKTQSITKTFQAKN